MKKVFLIMILLSGALWFSRYKIFKFYQKDLFFDSSPEKSLWQELAKIEEDRKQLAKYEIFKPSQGTRDAGPFINSKLHWQVGHVIHHGDLKLPEFIHKELSGEWIRKKPLFHKLNLDFSWMNELLQFDHWSLEKESPAFPPEHHYAADALPVPNYKDLISWAKLRLLYGREEKDMISAFKEVRHLTRLVWTNDTLMASMMTVALLNLELDIHEGNWQIIPKEILMRAKRYFYAMPLFTDLRLPNELFEKLTKTQLGVCPIVVQGMTNYLRLYPYLRNEHSEKFILLNQLVQNSVSHCRETIVHKLWEQPEQNFFAQGPVKLTGTIFGNKTITWEELREKEDFRAAIGYLLLRDKSIDFLSGYR